MEPRGFQHRRQRRQLNVLATTRGLRAVPGPGGGACGVYRLVSLAGVAGSATGFSLRSLQPFKIFFRVRQIRDRLRRQFPSRPLENILPGRASRLRSRPIAPACPPASEHTTIQTPPPGPSPDTRARSSSGHDPQRGPQHQTFSGLERSKANRRRRKARQPQHAPSTPPPSTQTTANPRADPSPAPISSRASRHEVAHLFLFRQSPGGARPGRAAAGRFSRGASRCRGRLWPR